jgi:hypothetical protein
VKLAPDLLGNAENASKWCLRHSVRYKCAYVRNASSKLVLACPEYRMHDTTGKASRNLKDLTADIQQLKRSTVA